MKQAKDIHESIRWQDMTPGCEIYEGGTSLLTRTGEWRVVTPPVAEGQMQAVPSLHAFLPRLPPSPVRDSRRQDFDYDHCKGCGICAKVCPFSAIEFKEEV